MKQRLAGKRLGDAIQIRQTLIEQRAITGRLVACDKRQNSASLTFKDISPAYLPPADGRAAFVSKNVDAWVAWDPFLTSAQRQSGAKVLSDGVNLANYKRYYLASERTVQNRSDVLQVIFAKLDETGQWVKKNPKEAATVLAGLWGIDTATVEEANSHRSYRVGVITRDGLSEQQKIADVFFDEGLIPRKLDTTEIKIWQPKQAQRTQ